MKNQQEIEKEIKRIEKDFKHILNGSLATITVNAPRALQQISVESKLTALYWTIGRQFKSKLVGVDD